VATKFCLAFWFACTGWMSANRKGCFCTEQGFCSALYRGGKPGESSVVLQTMGTYTRITFSSRCTGVKSLASRLLCHGTTATRGGARAATRGGYNRGRRQRRKGVTSRMASRAMAKISRGGGCPLPCTRGQGLLHLLEYRGRPGTLLGSAQKGRTTAALFATLALLVRARHERRRSRSR
jgi:hypothetical protein